MYVLYGSGATPMQGMRWLECGQRQWGCWKGQRQRGLLPTTEPSLCWYAPPVRTGHVAECEALLERVRATQGRGRGEGGGGTAPTTLPGVIDLELQRLRCLEAARQARDLRQLGSLSPLPTVPPYPCHQRCSRRPGSDRGLCRGRQGSGGRGRQRPGCTGRAPGPGEPLMVQTPRQILAEGRRGMRQVHPRKTSPEDKRSLSGVHPGRTPVGGRRCLRWNWSATAQQGTWGPCCGRYTGA